MPEAHCGETVQSIESLEEALGLERIEKAGCHQQGCATGQVRAEQGSTLKAAKLIRCYLGASTFAYTYVGRACSLFRPQLET